MMSKHERGWIRTFTGKRFWPLDPSADDARIEDVAHALSNVCRFTGHCASFYSVAEHSVRAARLVMNWQKDNRELALKALLHDASEAYLSDVATPVKRQPAFKAYRKAEKRLQRVLLKKWTGSPNEPALVKYADLVMLANEVRDLLPNRVGFVFGDIRPEGEKIRPWSPEKARQEFLKLFKKLRGKK